METLPESMGGMESLREVYLSDNRIRRIPASMGDLTKLTSLYIEATPLSADERNAISNTVPQAKTKF